MPSFLDSIKSVAKSFVFKYTRLGAPTYRYCIEPIQLATLITEIEKTKNIPGNIVEIGVARGLTTRFLCQHIRNQGLDKSLTLYAIDTFDSFTDADIEFEVNQRGKSLFDLEAFTYNDYDTWKQNFTAFPFVKAIKADCSLVDYAAIAPVKVALLDVDLYLPTSKTLPKLYDALVSGGCILIDDVLPNNTWDGAYQAYMEFCDAHNMKPEIIGTKCGVIRKP